jgi:hypothetical protein
MYTHMHAGALRAFLKEYALSGIPEANKRFSGHMLEEFQSPILPMLTPLL